MKCCPARYTVAILTAVGAALMYGLRVNIGMTIVHMVNYTGKDEQSSGGPCGNKTSNKEKIVGEYDWSNELQGIILSSYYWGYIIVMLPGARLSELTSVKWVWFTAVLFNVIGCLLTPISCDIHYGMLLAVRMMQGFGSGATFPATSLILARWVPISERNTMGSIAYSGTMVGLVTSTISTGLIEIYLGWRAVFYIMGSICIPYLFAWAIFVADSPAKSKYISKEEVEFILSSLGDKVGQKKKLIIHWKNIFKSKPFWALLITHGSANWVGYFLVTELPIYMDKVFQLDMDYITMYIAIGGTISWIFSIILGRTLDYLRTHKGLTQTKSKKIATLTTFVPIAFALIGMAFVGCEIIIGIALCITVYMVWGGSFCGWMSNHVDIGPKIAATLMGMTNIAGTVSGILVPLFVGWVLGDGTDINSWFIIYWVNAGFAVFLICVYMFLGSGEAQNYYDEIEVTP